MRILKIVVISLVVLIAGVLILASTRPADFRVERTATINAPADSIFPLINTMSRWSEWSPWEKLDTNMTREYSGPPSGVGAAYTWAGNNDVGEGRMEIIESSHPSRVEIKLDFIKPFEASNITEFQLRQVGESTVVTWIMSGTNNLMSKVFGLFMNMDEMIGNDFNTGLSNLKAAVNG